MTMRNRHAERIRTAIRQRNWKHIHHSPVFWIGVVLCMSAITIYVLSEDLSWHPRH